jgi:hypothetical protein
MGEHLSPGIARSESATSPVSTPLGEIFETLGLPAPHSFGRSTAETFVLAPDQWLDGAARLRVAVLLGLVDVEEIAAVTGLGADETIQTFGLDPYLTR